MLCATSHACSSDADWCLQPGALCPIHVACLGLDSPSSGLGQCYHSGLGNHNCNAGEMVGLQCFNSADSRNHSLQNQGALRLSNGVRSLRHHLEPFPSCFTALCHPAPAVGCALLSDNAYSVLIGACDPMSCPIHVVRHRSSRPLADSRYNW